MSLVQRQPIAQARVGYETPAVDAVPNLVFALRQQGETLAVPAQRLTPDHDAPVPHPRHPAPADPARVQNLQRLLGQTGRQQP